MTKYIYIAGPYTLGDVGRNVAAAMEAARELIDNGLYPYIPHLSHFLHMHHPQPYDTWMELDFAWLEKCGAVVRLQGESKGADAEVARAKQLGLPVFQGVTECIDAMEDKADIEVAEQRMNEPRTDFDEAMTPEGT